MTISEIWRYVSASVSGCWGFCEWAKMAHNHFNDSNDDVDVKQSKKQ